MMMMMMMMMMMVMMKMVVWYSHRFWLLHLTGEFVFAQIHLSELFQQAKTRWDLSCPPQSPTHQCHRTRDMGKNKVSAKILEGSKIDYAPRE